MQNGLFDSEEALYGNKSGVASYGAEGIQSAQNALCQRGAAKAPLSPASGYDSKTQVHKYPYTEFFSPLHLADGPNTPTPDRLRDPSECTLYMHTSSKCFPPSRRVRQIKSDRSATSRVLCCKFLAGCNPLSPRTNPSASSNGES